MIKILFTNFFLSLFIYSHYVLSDDFNPIDAATRLLGDLGVKKGLIINGDDLGMGRAINKGIFSAWNKKIITSSSLQTIDIFYPIGEKYFRFNNFDEVFGKIKNQKDLDVGLHLTLNSTDGLKMKPVLPAHLVPTLVDEEGFLKTGPFTFLSASPEEILAEGRAQIEKALKNGIKLSHLDCHLIWGHSFPTYKRIYASLAHEYNLPLRWPIFFYDGNLLSELKISIPGDKFGNTFMLSNLKIRKVTPEVINERKAFFLKKLENLPDGISEVICHPSSEESKQKWRVVDYIVLNDPDVRNIIETMVEKGELALIGYRQLKEYAALNSHEFESRFLD